MYFDVMFYLHCCHPHIRIYLWEQESKDIECCLFLYHIDSRTGPFGRSTLFAVQVYERLVVLGENYPIGGNKHGSYLTGWSLGSLEINIIYVSPTFSSISPSSMGSQQLSCHLTVSGWNVKCLCTESRCD